jgi:2-dehydro-3-deoxyphosphogluconate aldolase / (4S)-4-hydroxy-2-oxoglutarate aldolase
LRGIWKRILTVDETTKQTLRVAKVIPVVTVEDATQGLSTAAALLKAGLPVIEITLRTDAAMAAIAAIKREHPEMCVGAGTVRSADDVQQAESAGADFLVTPGVTPTLLDALRSSKAPATPGAQTVSHRTPKNLFLHVRYARRNVAVHVREPEIPGNGT